MQSSIVTGLLIGHNILKRHLYVMGLTDSPSCRRCGAEEETSIHVLCECEAVVISRHTYLGYFFFDPEDVKSLSLRTIWNFIQETGLP